MKVNIPSIKAICILAGVIHMTPAQAADGDAPGWEVRVAATHIATRNGVDSVAVNGGAVAGADLTTSNPTVPSLTITKLFGENIGVELFCCFAGFDVDGAGALAGARVARTTAFAPALTVQYRLGSSDGIQPYVGAGAQALFFFDSKARLAGFTDASVDTAFGPTVQAGVNVPIGRSAILNLDVKKSFFSTDAELTGAAGRANANNVQLDPWIFSAGFGFRF